MKTKISFTAFIITALLVSISIYSVSSSGYATKKIYCDKNGVYIAQYSESNLSVSQLVPTQSSYSYSFNNQLRTCCIYNKKAYVLVENPKIKNTCILYIIKNASSSKEILLHNINVNSSTMLSLDKNENIYVINSKDKVQVYNKSGKQIYTPSTTFYYIIPFKGYTLASNNKGFYKLTSSSHSILANNQGECLIYKISEDYFGDYSGNVYKVSNGVSKILNIGKRGFFNVAETKNYLVSFSGNTLYAYNKNSGVYVGSYDCDDVIYAISTFKNKIAIINQLRDKYMCETVSQSKAFPKYDAENNNVSSGSLNLNAFIHNKKYIYVDNGTTIAVFKNKISYGGYEISFGDRKSGKIGTNMQVEFSKGKTVLKYRFIVRGDVTGEGNVNSRDTNALFYHLLNTSKLKGTFRLAGNLNGDGKISNADLVLCAQKM